MKATLRACRMERLGVLEILLSFQDFADPNSSRCLYASDGFGNLVWVGGVRWSGVCAWRKSIATLVIMRDRLWHAREMAHRLRLCGFLRAVYCVRMCDFA